MSTPFKMRGFSGFGSSPVTKKGEVVSVDSPGEGWTKTKGTNIWAPPMGFTKKVATKRTNLARVTNAVTRTKKPTYRQAWADMSEKEKAKHGDYATFVKSAKTYNKKNK